MESKISQEGLLIYSWWAFAGGRCVRALKLPLPQPTSNRGGKRFDNAVADKRAKRVEMSERTE